MELTWSLKNFDALSPLELYKILQLRNEVFVVEQNCVFQDADDKDQYAHHLMGWVGKDLAVYTRLLPPGVAYAEPSIGRVVSSPAYRRKGMGKILMIKSIETIQSLFGKQPVRIGAQLYLRSFYEGLGFRKCSDVYLEDSIEHIYMLLDSHA